jgi:urease accessory protein
VTLTAGVPAEFAALDRPVMGGLPVGAPGKVGVLELSLEQLRGTTRVVRQFQRAPLHVYRPIYLDESVPGMAFVYVQQFGDGYVDGDRCHIDVECGTDTTVHVTTQSATNVYRSAQNFAAQVVNLSAEAGAFLEYLPDAVIPFRDARFFSRTCLTAAADSTAIVGELLLPGRVARGELHVYDMYWAETEARRPDGTLLFADVIRLSPAAGYAPRSLALLGVNPVLGTLYVVSQRVPAGELVELVRGTSRGEDVLVGASELPNGCGVSARFLGPTSKAVQAAQTAAWSAVRVALLGAPAPDLRKGGVDRWAR